MNAEPGSPVMVRQRWTRAHLTIAVDHRALETMRRLLTPSHRPYSLGDARKSDESRTSAES